ncbi:hypothetical protein DWF00_12940 [Bosea caraganae]|uniref:Uncharacterized protein n=1 Tax=Bosea caraganae TaxID=2763117 RepID=A0A370LCY1_9HYPH|nr:hypothetical protein [Bosea caraganae]RDJ27820.1 hypothetical protein DWF00_12940 [Bosea caraganae]RDJ29833.1 hypothetical protein DWE98_04710 [Bosea caraganae]
MTAAGAALLALALAGCGTIGETALDTAAPQAVGSAPPPPAGFTNARLIGRWGIASYHTEKDRKRTEAQAKAQCGQPYTITKGPTDGVMMHVADDPKPYELKLKAGPANKVYLGFEAPAGDPQDREVQAVSSNILTMRFVDADADRRYGTFVYVRCGA